MKKFFGFILVVIVILGAVLFVARNQVVKIAIEQGANKALGLDVKVGQINIDFKNTQLGINNFKIMNPKGYSDPLMFSMPEMFINYNLKDILGGKIHLEEVRLDIEQLIAIKNNQGELNLSVFQPKDSTSTKSENPVDSKKDKGKKKDMNLQIDRASVKLGKIVFKDYSKDEKPEVQEYNVNLDETFENITDVQSIISIIVQKAMMKSAFSGLGVDFGAMQENFSKDAGKALQNFKKSIKIPSFK